MLTSETTINILGLSSLSVIIALALILAYKMRLIKNQLLQIEKLKSSLDEMDEQAKLIVRTDMELNKTQEELDKKIKGLYALQKLSHGISTTLEEKQIFQMVKPEHLEELEFERACAFLWSEKEKKFLLQLNIGFLACEMETVEAFVEQNRQNYADLIRNEKTISSISGPIGPNFKENLNKVFGVNSFVISAILPKDGSGGFLFVGTQNQEAILNEGDEELISILANQIGQALENARLFEETWRAQQGLEKKVEERTRELTRVLDEVRVISKRKTDFISSVSHELRTPLTSIKGYASILLGGNLGNIPPAALERLEKINRHSDELTHMVNGLLDIARIESGRVAMKNEALELKGIVDKIYDLLAEQLRAKQINFTSNIADVAGNIFADRTQIERVFINLLGNALKFTPANGKITVSARREGQMAQIDIADTGCGIPAEALESLFQEFFRVDNAINQEAKGTGLGLSLVKHIIEAQKGKIWVKSSPGSGSVFSFTLPMAN
ncbi:MAG: ATP-binding protein [Candidatus Omnitrophota bacterium]